jgi:signal transduction histidine kinase
VKLLTRTNIYFITLTLIVFTLGGVVFYKTLRSITRQDATERLEEEKDRIIRYVSMNNALPKNEISLGDTIAFYPSSIAVAEKNGRTKLFNVAEKEYEPYQTLEFNVSVKGQNYHTVIFKPLLEADDLQRAIFIATGIVSLILLIVLFSTNIIVSRLIWKPFYQTLEKIKIFDLTKHDSIEFDETSIKEFKEMNMGLRVLTKKIAADYKNLKQFTENASHELQTPLSIIQSKLELMIQSEEISAKQMQEVQVIYEATGRLSKLNQALLLLAKIENRQFTDTQQVAVNELIGNKLIAYKELFENKDISVEKQLEPVPIEMHPILADVLFSNLIGNSIKHNTIGGKINIVLNRKGLKISNSGGVITIPPHELFHRFRKASNVSDSLGLGLAIVKEICDAYGFDVQYSYVNNMHTINIVF